VGFFIENPKKILNIKTLQITNNVLLFFYTV